MNCRYLMIVIMMLLSLQIYGLSTEEQKLAVLYNTFIDKSTMENYKEYVTIYSKMPYKSLKVNEQHLDALFTLFEKNVVQKQFEAGYREKLINLALALISSYEEINNQAKVVALWKKLGTFIDSDPSFQPSPDVSKRAVAFAKGRAAEYLAIVNNNDLQLWQRFAGLQKAYDLLIEAGKISQPVRDELIKAELVIDENVIKEHLSEEIWLQAVKKDLDEWQKYISKYPVSTKLNEKFFDVYQINANELSKFGLPIDKTPRASGPEESVSAHPLDKTLLASALGKPILAPAPKRPAKPVAKKTAPEQDPLTISLQALTSTLNDLTNDLSAL